jgi:large subunit ribosomal protein L24
MKVRKNDTVMVMTGKDRGKKGRVRFVFPKEERLIVEGVNMIKKHTRAVGGIRQAGILEREAPMHISNVMLVCPKCNKSVRVGFRFLEDGRKVRFCKRCQEVVD